MLGRPTAQTNTVQASGTELKIQPPARRARAPHIKRWPGGRKKTTVHLVTGRPGKLPRMPVSSGPAEIFGTATNISVKVGGTMPVTPTQVQLEEALEIVKSLKDVPINSRALVSRAIERQIAQANSSLALHASDRPLPTANDPDIAHLLGRELWVAGKNENPAEFIRRVYADELANKTLTRAHLRRVDLALYDSYAVWITPKRHPADDLGLSKVPHPAFTSPDRELAHKKALKSNAMRKHRARKRDPTLAV